MPNKHHILYGLFLLLAMLLLSPPVIAGKLYEQCTAAATNSGMDMFECREDYFARLETELEQALEDVLDTLKSRAGFDEAPDFVTRQGDFDIRTYIDEEQEKWREYEKTTCLLFAARDDGDRGERIFGSLGAEHILPECRIFVIKQRIELLRYQACEFDDLCVGPP